MLITLTTDFGLRDWFVGTMKGVLLSINPDARIIDITHDIPPGEVRSGAFALAAAVPFFPRGSIHVAIVDPGVGTGRAALAAQTRNGFFVGPDNGVLSLVLAQDAPERICRLENPAYFLPKVSRTFHGRDVFAPVAGHLSNGVPLGELGPEVHSWECLSFPQPVAGSGEVLGELVYVDRFGNAITNVPNEMALGLGAAEIHIRNGPNRLPLLHSYHSAPRGHALGVPGSAGFLELAINGGNAAEILGLHVGDAIRVTRITAAL